MVRRTGFLLFLLFLLLAPTGIAQAVSRYDRVISDGDVVEGDVTVVDNDLLIEAGGIVRGNVTVFDGNAEVAGQIDGDIAIFGGELELNGTVNGDLVVFSGELALREGAQINGDCVSFGGAVLDHSPTASCTTFGSGFAESLGPLHAMPMPEHAQPPMMEHMPTRSLSTRMVGLFIDVSRLIGLTLSLGILALVVTAVFPRQLAEVSKTIQTRPAASGAVGLLTAIAGPSVIVLLLVVLALTCVGLLLYPAVFLLALALLAAVVMGWIALGDLLGRKLAGALGLSDRSLPVTAALGTALLTLLMGVFHLLPLLIGEVLVLILLGALGLGAAALTQFGTRPYPPGPVRRSQSKIDRTLETMPGKGAHE